MWAVFEVYVCLGNLMYLENAAVQVQVARALTKFYSSKGSQTICIGMLGSFLNFKFCLLITFISRCMF